jgi:hypothetical protein
VLVDPRIHVILRYTLFYAHVLNRTPCDITRIREPCDITGEQVEYSSTGAVCRSGDERPEIAGSVSKRSVSWEVVESERDTIERRDKARF